MRSVGIKILKNKLSSYLDYVRKGEIVLVTDRDEVIAEIRKPTRAQQGPSLSRLEAFLEDCISRGAMTRAQEATVFPRTSSDLLKLSVKINALDLLEGSRSERD